MAAHSYSHTKRLNTVVISALLALTAITVYAASFDFGSANVVVALLIASAKASLVALYFMHLRYEKPINAIIFVLGIITLALFLIFVLLDVDSRHIPRPADLKPPAGGPGQVSAEVDAGGATGAAVGEAAEKTAPTR